MSARSFGMFPQMGTLVDNQTILTSDYVIDPKFPNLQHSETVHFTVYVPVAGVDFDGTKITLQSAANAAAEVQALNGTYERVANSATFASGNITVGPALAADAYTAFLRSNAEDNANGKHTAAIVYSNDANDKGWKVFTFNTPLDDASGFTGDVQATAALDLGATAIVDTYKAPAAAGTLSYAADSSQDVTVTVKARRPQVGSDPAAEVDILTFDVSKAGKQLFCRSGYELGPIEALKYVFPADTSRDEPEFQISVS